VLEHRAELTAVLVLLALQNALKRIRVLHLDIYKKFFGLFNQAFAGQFANHRETFIFVKHGA
jgi:hypothetical protein